jgi:hypothetical protein
MECNGPLAFFKRPYRVVTIRLPKILSGNFRPSIFPSSAALRRSVDTTQTLYENKS